MPGISLHYFKDRTRPEGENQGFKTLYSRPEFELIIRADKDYPIRQIDTPDFLAFVEGKIYGNSNLLTDALINLWNSEANSADYFWSLDGEFVIFLVSKTTDRVIFINDFLGRLPVYMHNGSTFILSRDLLTLNKLKGYMEFDPSGIYQYLRLGFPLGKRTLYQGVERVRYKSVLQIHGGNVEKELGPEWNIHGKEPASPQIVYELYQCFRSAVKTRAESGGEIGLSLSGGLDSRAILGALEKEKSNYELHTFHYSNPIIDRDLQASQKLAELYGRKLNQVHLDEWSPQNFHPLIKAKMGMNYLGMAFIYEFLETFKNVDLMLTGDGGDKTLAPLLPLLDLSEKKFVRHLLSENEIASREELESILNIDIEKEEKFIVDHLSQLTGTNSKDKYKSFLFFEKSVNWLFEGEDRNRDTLWSTSPFYNPGFFKIAHSISERDKTNYSLFKSFMDKIDPALNHISNANWNISLAEKSRVRQLFLKQKIKQAVKKFYRKKSPGEQPENAMRKRLVNHLRELDFQAKLPFVKKYGNEMNTELAWHILTLVYLSPEIKDK